MANVKISDLTEFVTAEPTDVVPVVDLVNDQTKKIKIENLARASADGTAAAPGIAFSADRDTGIYRPAANQFGISTGGVSRLVIDDSGDITIGGDVTANSITFSSNLTVAGNLTVNGTTTTINSTTLQVDDKNIELGTVASATDATADGGGITLKGTTDHTIIWTDSTDSWDLSEHLNIASAKEFRIAGTKVLDATSLGSAVVSSSLTSVGTLSSLTVSGDLTVDTTTLHVDSTNDRVGIGTTSPQDELHVDGNDATIRVNDPRSTNPLTISQLNTSAEIIHGGNGGLTFGLSNIGDINFVNQVSKTSRMVIANDGKVGIGTTNPSAKLVVEDDTFIYFDLNRTGAAAGLCRLANSGNVLDVSNNVNGVTFSTGTTPSEAVRINSNGRLLVGTSSALDTEAVAPRVQSASADNTAGFGAFRYSANAPGPIFHFFKSRGGSVGTNTIVQDGDTLGEIRFAGADGTNEIIGAQIISKVDGTPGTNDMPGNLIFSTTADGASSSTQRMVITPAGLVGIGTTSPNKLLHISGTDPIIQITDTDAGINSQIGNVGDDLYISNDFAAAGASPTIQFWNANAEIARFDSNGRLGIGTTSPVRALHVNQSSSVIRIQDSDGTNQYAEIIHSSGGTYIDSRNNTGSGSIIFRGISGTEYARISGQGRLGIGTTSPGYALDVNSGSTSIAARLESTAVDAFLSLESSGTDLGYVRIAASGNDFAVRANNVERMRLAASGVNSFRNNSSEVARIDGSGNILLGGTSTPGSATKSLAIFNGTAPTGSVANGVLLYAEDVSSSSELKVRDEAGNVTTLSPHNFDLIPEGPSEDMAWSYYSEKDGKRINVDMLKAIRILEQLSGEQLVFSS